MGMAAILVMWPRCPKQTFVPLTHGDSTWNLASIGPAVLEKIFESGGWMTKDGRACLNYKLTNASKGSSELKKKKKKKKRKGIYYTLRHSLTEIQPYRKSMCMHRALWYIKHFRSSVYALTVSLILISLVIHLLCKRTENLTLLPVDFKTHAFDTWLTCLTFVTALGQYQCPMQTFFAVLGRYWCLRFMSGINIDLGSQQMLNTDNPWLNFISNLVEKLDFEKS